MGLILGSGLNELVDGLTDARSVAYAELPGFPECSAPGHRGHFVTGSWHGHDVIAVAGRFHAYEGHPPEHIVLPVVVLGVLGIRRIVVSNAAGALNPEYPVGAAVLIRDHVNLLPEQQRLAKVLKALARVVHRGPGGQRHRIRTADGGSDGPADDHARSGPATRPADSPTHHQARPAPVVPDSVWRRFRTEPYPPGWRDAVVRAARTAAWPVYEGVYAALCGPTYETPAEVRWLRRMGVDLVGMSSVPEVLAAAAMGIRTLAFSLVTNSHARGPQSGGLRAEHVLREARAAAPVAESVIRTALETARHLGASDASADAGRSGSMSSDADSRSEPDG